jgi:hypothetical protein
MQIFQKSVIKKHLKNLDQDKVEKAFQIFKQNYNPAKIEQIKTLKEEEYQDGFLREIFVDVFGYTLRPNENYDLQREFKNKTDGKKADGAILKNDNAIADSVLPTPVVPKNKNEPIGFLASCKPARLLLTASLIASMASSCPTTLRCNSSSNLSSFSLSL